MEEWKKLVDAAAVAVVAVAADAAAAVDDAAAAVADAAAAVVDDAVTSAVAAAAVVVDDVAFFLAGLVWHICPRSSPSSSHSPGPAGSHRTASGGCISMYRRVEMNKYF